MKNKKSSSGSWLYHNQDQYCEIDLEDLPEKIVKVDEDIEVSVLEVSHRISEENPSWMSSLDLTRCDDPQWLNESSLVLAGTRRSKRKENGLWKSKTASFLGPNMNKTSYSPVKKGGQLFNSDKTVLNGYNVAPNSQKCVPKVILTKNPMMENISRYNYDSNGDKVCAKSNLSKNLDSFKTLSPSRRAGLSPRLRYSNLVSSDASDTRSPSMDSSSSSLQQCDSSDSSSFNKTENEIKLELSSDSETDSLKQFEPLLNGTEQTETVCSSKNPNPQESDVEYPPSKTNSEKGKISSNNSKPSREIKQLFVSLKEIPWAQNWNPKTVLSNQKPKRRTSKRNLTPSKSPAKKSSSLSKKKAVKILATKSSRKIMAVKSPKKLQLGKNEPRYKLPKTKLKKIPEDDEIRYKIPQYPIKKVNQEQKSQPKPSMKRNIDTKKGFAIRFDFIDTKKNEKNDLKRKHLANNEVATKNVQIQMTKANKGMFPELKIKLEPIETTTKQRKEALGYCNNSKTHPDNVNFHNMDAILQRKIIKELRVKDSPKDPAKRRKTNDESIRLSTRQTEASFRYKEIAVRKHPGFVQIILIPNNDKQKGLSVEALIELKEALIAASKDQSCKLVLLNSSGSVFCCGIDLSPLLSVDKTNASERIAIAIKDLVNEMALLSKPLVAAVNGDCFGFGVSILPLCDVVFASDKAFFYTPYAKIGYIPEAALTLTLPQAVGTIVASDMLLRGRKLTAQEAKINGLVSEVIWPTMLMEEVIPRVKKMVSQPLKAMELTKMMLRSNQLERLKLTLENETRLLPKQWLSTICQKNIRNYVTLGRFDN